MVQPIGCQAFEVLTSRNRQRWTDEQKAQIVAESFVCAASPPSLFLLFWVSERVHVSGNVEMRRARNFAKFCARM